MQKAVIYARYSSAAQRDTSIDQQIQVCMDYAKRQDLQVVGIFDDRAMTGTNDHRPRFQAMIQEAARSDWDYVLVYALDRFARDRYDSAIHKKRLKDAGVRVLSATESISDDPSGILMESVLEGMAEYYSAELAAKTQRGMIDNARKCRVNGPLPPGYQKGPDGRYEIQEQEAAAVREIFQRTRSGEAVKTILEDFQRRGLRQHGKPWNRGTVDRALSREIYTGVYIYGDVRVEGGVPQIIDRETFDAVQVLLNSKKNPRAAAARPNRRRRQNGVYLLTGKLFCGDCKSPMVGVSGHNHAGAPYYYYVCKGHRAGSGCKLKPVRRDQIEYAVTAALQKVVLNSDVIPALADAYLQHLAEGADSLELQGIDASLTDVKKRIDNIMQAIESGVITPTVTARLKDLEAEEQRLSLQAEEIRRRLAFLPSREDLILTLMMYADGDAHDPEFQQTILDTFLVAAYVYADKFRLVFSLGDKEAQEDLPLDFDPDAIFGDDPEAPEGSYKESSGSPLDPIRTNHAEVVFINGLFAVQFLIGKENHL